MNFYEKMRIVCMEIPYGKVATYGQIAMLCGKPKNSRQVGYGLREGKAGDEVPAYRVVNSKGELSGAVHFEMSDQQKMFLQEEGVEVHWNGKCWTVDLKKFGWKNTLEDAYILKAKFEYFDKL